jgi:hypothetical protein
MVFAIGDNIKQFKEFYVKVKTNNSYKFSTIHILNLWKENNKHITGYTIMHSTTILTLFYNELEPYKECNWGQYYNNYNNIIDMENASWRATFGNSSINGKVMLAKMAVDSIRYYGSDKINVKQSFKNIVNKFIKGEEIIELCQLKCTA